MLFKNNIARFTWGFAAIFLSFNAAMTYVLIRDGVSNIQINPPDNLEVYPPWVMPGVMAIFWMAGYALATVAASKPCIEVRVLPDNTVLARWKYPFKTEQKIIPFAEMPPAQMCESVDDENSPYFFSRISLPDGLTLDIQESHVREICEQACAEFNQAIAKH